MAMKTMTRKLLGIIKSIDFFGSNIRINYKKNYKLKTQFGGALTILAICFAIGLAWMLGKEIVYKDNPLLIFTKVQKNISEVYMKDIPVFMDFLDRYGNPLMNPESFIDFYAEQIFFVQTGNTFYTSRQNNFTLERCKPTKHFGKYIDLLSSIYIKENAVCMNVENDTMFYNDYASIPSSYFGVGLKMCDNATRPEGKKCAEKSYFDEVWKLFYVRCAMPDYFIDPLKFEGPAELYLYTKIQDVSIEYNFRNYMMIKTSEIITDVGWFSDDIKSQKITQFSGIIPDVGTSLPSDPLLKYYFSFESPILGDQYKRSYLKVPSVIASMGGVLNILFVIGKVICFKINEISMYLQESKDLVNFNEEDINDLSDPQKSSNDPFKNSNLNLINSRAKDHFDNWRLEHEEKEERERQEKELELEIEENKSGNATFKDNKTETLKMLKNDANLKDKDLSLKSTLKNKSKTATLQAKVKGKHNKDDLQKTDKIEIVPVSLLTPVNSTTLKAVNTEDNILKLNQKYNDLDHLQKMKIDSPVRRNVPRNIAAKAQEKKLFNKNIKWKVDELVKDASGNYIRQKINFCSYLSVTLCSTKHANSLKSRKIILDAIIDFFKTKVDIRNIIKQSNDVEILKYLILGNYPNYDQLFNLKFPLDQIVKDFEYCRLNKDKVVKDEEEKKNTKDDREENEYQKEVRKILVVMKDNFNQKTLFD